MIPETGGCFQEKEFGELLLKLKRHFDSHYLVSEIPQILSQIHRSKFIIRHDVSRCLDTAVRMAELEHSMDIRATYLFNPVSPEIHPERQQVRNSIQAIRNFKHEVGLHLPGKNPQALKDVVALSRKLEKYLSIPILSVSFAETHRELPPGSFFIRGKISASSRIMMGWHVSDKTSSLTGLNPRPSESRPMLQVIIHPENWMKSEKR